MFPENNEVRDARASTPPSNLVGLYFDQLRGEIINILAKDASYFDTIQKLETELGVYKRAYADLDLERRQSEKLKQEADKQREDLENQLKGHRIVTLLDGDGAIFSSNLISQGQAGGHAAARLLSDSIIQHVSSMCGTNRYQLWVYVFLNKRGLVDTLGRLGFGAAKTKFDDFLAGFNQAAERFMVIDVGNGKEAADAKIKAMLEDEIRLPQTEKIVFGGCHDNGYVTTLRSQITAGFKNKMILLPGYTEVAAGIGELELPILTIPDLFMSQKLGTLAHSPPRTPSPPLDPSSTPLKAAISRRLSDVSSSDLSEVKMPTNQDLDVLPFATVELDAVMSASKARPQVTPSYSSAVRSSPRRAVVVPEIDLSGSATTSSDGELLYNPLALPTPLKPRHIRPNLPLSKHTPPPCTLFYIASCKHGAECKYAHDYLLQPEHLQEIRTNAKKVPCPAINKGDLCVWDDDCCYGHKCPQTTKCHFLKQGRCKFIGADMHKE